MGCCFASAPSNLEDYNNWIDEYLIPKARNASDIYSSVVERGKSKRAIDAAGSSEVN